MGVVCHHWDWMYESYLNTTHCERCKASFETSQDRCLDHDHVSGLQRAILCQTCNKGNLLDLHPFKNNKLGIKNISIHQKLGYNYRKTLHGVLDAKWFKTLDEALAYKTQYIQSLLLAENV